MQIGYDERVGLTAEVAPLVSIIIPAYNAAATLRGTLDSVQRQTFVNWEAIVVDDGSRDDTAQVAEQIAEGDPRVRVLRQSNQGVSHARNTGIAQARGVWLFFLDSDDVILPEHLETLVDGVESDPGNGAAFSGWQYRTPDGRVTKMGQQNEAGELFNGFARTALFPIHCCLVRRDLVQQVGGFDATLRTCEDWDLWQRVARTGAKFARREGFSAVYQMRPLSLSRDVKQMLADGKRVIETGFSADPRVPRPAPQYAQGQQAGDPLEIQICFVAWIGGEIIGLGEDPVWLLERIPQTRGAPVTPSYVADAIFDGAVTSACVTTSDWPLIWARSETRIRGFLAAIEEHTGTPRLAERALRVLERVIHNAASSPTTIGATHAVALDISEPLADVHVPLGVERLHVRVAMAGASLGTLELPVTTEIMPFSVIADAIAARFSWEILGRYLASTSYPTLTVDRSASGTRVLRDGALLLEAPEADVLADDGALHNAVGWSVFLQEVWDRPGWLSDAFYSRRTVDAGPRAQLDARDRRWVAIEVSQDVPDLLVSGPVQAVLTVAGVALEVVTLSDPGGVIKAQQVRAALTSAAGLNLCRACVREALIGKPLSGPGLRQRLAEAARNRPAVRELDGGEGVAIVAGHVRFGEPTELAEAGAIFARREPGESLTAQSGLASIPAGIMGELRGAAQGSSEVVLGQQDDVAGWYVPEIVPLGGVAGARVPMTPALGRLAAPLAPIAPVVASAAMRGTRLVARGARSSVKRVARKAPALAARWPVAGRGQVSHGVRPVGNGETLAAVVHDTVPVLMYHRLAASGADVSARYRLDPQAFEAQLAWLRDAGYHSVRLAELAQALEYRRPLDGRRVLLTFDDAYVDFAEVGWPLLKRYGFGATLFVVSELTGRTNEWDARMGEELALLGWEALRKLHADGLEIGAHSATHAPLTGLSPREVGYEAARSRRVIQQQLGAPVRAFAYPYGDVDEVVEQVVGACGFTLGFTCVSQAARLSDAPLAVPRIEVKGTDTLEAFSAAVGV